MSKHVGILTAGGDTPGLNAAIRAVGKACHSKDMQFIGFLDGFRGLMQNRTMRMDDKTLSGILTVGGTILGTSRDKPHKMSVGGQKLDMTEAMLNTYNEHHLDVLVCLGGGGTQKNAYRLAQTGMNIITLPKTIDNDVAMTDVTFGFDTALGIATEAIDRLHSTAHSHHRIIVVEVMGHNTGWLALGSGVAGGADVILIPEVPYDTEVVAEAIRRRSREGKRFSIVCVSEGAMSQETAVAMQTALDAKEAAESEEDKRAAKDVVNYLEAQRTKSTEDLAHKLEELTGLESRITILGYIQRGGTPSAVDRLLATKLGTACADYIEAGTFGIMVAAKGVSFTAVPLEQVVGKRRVVPLDHPWIQSARLVGTCMGD